jgi:hypothetical protein
LKNRPLRVPFRSRWGIVRFYDATGKPTLLYILLVEISDASGWYSSREATERTKTLLSRPRDKLQAALGGRTSRSAGTC